MAITEGEVWAKLKECYDPELPCNIVDLGLVYDVKIAPIEQTDEKRIDVKMTLTTPGCPMSGPIAAQVQRKLLELDGVGQAHIDLVFDPPWNAARISDSGRKTLGLG